MTGRFLGGYNNKRYEHRGYLYHFWLFFYDVVSVVCSLRPILGIPSFPLIKPPNFYFSFDRRLIGISVDEN